VEGRHGGGAGVDGCGEMTGLRFGGSIAVKKKNSSDGSSLHMNSQRPSLLWLCSPLQNVKNMV
jgi:hypothetical protein